MFYIYTIYRAEVQALLIERDPMDIVDRKIAELVHPDYNPRQISEKDFAQLKKSLEKFTAVEPAVINTHKGRKNIIVGGNQRIRAAQSLGWVDFPCVEVDLTLTKEKELNIRLNKNTGDFDFDMLANEFEINDLLEWGFDEKEFDVDMFGDEFDGLTDDDVPDIPDDPTTKLGDVYKLGEHRLMCGDSTSIDAVEKLLDGAKANMVFTDPPYGVNYDGGIQFTNKGAKTGQRKKIDNDDSAKIYTEILPIISIFLIGPAYIWFAGTKAKELYSAIDDNNFDLHALIIWIKNGGYGALNANYKQKHEPCLYCKPKKTTLNFIGDTTETTIWEIDKDGKNKLHPTQKPVALAERAIGNHKADIVLDLFGGSGSTLIACEKTKRKCRMMELDPKYCDVIVKRWEDFAGNKAELTNA